jgi:hypothetical protein
MQFITKIEQGKVSDGVRQSLQQALKSLDGKIAKITIEERKKVRSLSQNAFYWGCIIPPIVTLLREYGNDVDGDDTHEFLMENVGKLNKNIVLLDGEVKTVSGSSAILKPMEFEEYLTKVRSFAAEHGVILPLPNEHTLHEQFRHNLERN